MCEVRYMREGDAARVAEIQVSSWKTAYKGIMPQATLDRYNFNDRFKVWKGVIRDSPERNNLVIEDSGIMGWASYGECRDDDKDNSATRELWGIYIDPVRFRNGYGQKLWQRSKDEMLEFDPLEITLWVLEENDRARAFYESNGFRLDGMKKLPERLDGAVQVRMVLSIEK